MVLVEFESHFHGGGDDQSKEIHVGEDPFITRAVDSKLFENWVENIQNFLLIMNNAFKNCEIVKKWQGSNLFNEFHPTYGYSYPETGHSALFSHFKALLPKISFK